ncbi:MAG: PQQ-binding-like beta-propeller repeat protein [Acidobacteria bacterium]|nr:PQQ-binding-like beta-propeller repeat protein [Acidobacteriota bacterium]
MKKMALLLVISVVSILVTLPVGAQVKDFQPVTQAMLLQPDPADWLMLSRTYDYQRFSPLNQIRRDNVGRLRMVWARGMGRGRHENTPLVHRGVMYVANPGAVIQALDATNGDLIWEYRRKMPADLTDVEDSSGKTRSLGIYEDLIFYPAPDGHLVALDARTGRLRWETKVHDYATTQHGSAPLIVDGKVLTGRASSEERCFIAAHDALTGKELWRTYTAPAPGEPGGDTWGNVPVAKRTTSPWGNPGSFDPVRKMVYWGIANPTPNTRLARHGDPDAVSRSAPANLYSNSTVALDPSSGQIAWYYQHSPGDDWDLDHVQERVLVKSVVDPDAGAVKWISSSVPRGQVRDILLTVGEAGGLWALDRESGRFLWATPFPYDVPEFHLSKIDLESGKTFINWEAVAKKDGERHIVCFHDTKGYWPMAYHPGKNALYIPYNDYCLDQTANLQERSGTGPRVTIPRPGADPQALAGIAKVDVTTGRIQRFYNQKAPTQGAVLATAGDLVFWGDINRRFRAFDADTGKILWETIVGDNVLNGTITYAVDGKQYVAVVTGEAGRTRQLLYHNREIRIPVAHNAIYVFALPE